MKNRAICLIILLATLTANAEEEDPSVQALRKIDAQIAAEQAKGNKADRNVLAWLEAKRQQLLPPGPSADALNAEKQRAEQLEQERRRQQLEADAVVTQQLAKENDARNAARSEDYAARQQQEANALRTQQDQNSSSSLYIGGYPYPYGYPYGYPYIVPVEPKHDHHHPHEPAQLPAPQQDDAVLRRDKMMDTIQHYIPSTRH